MVTKTFTITNPTGLHARPASSLCALSKKFKSKITVVCGEKTVNTKSVISILLGEMSCGKEIQVTIEGEDEMEAAAAFTEFILNLKE